MFWNKKDSGKNADRIFLDYASITPVDAEVNKAMEEAREASFANPSALYTEARKAKELLVSSRQKVADVLGCLKNEIVFTASGTESNNIALLGVWSAFSEHGFVPHIITSEIEHPAILEVCREIEMKGGEVTYLPVSKEGLVSAKSVREAIKENTVLVSVMYANNEIGTVQALKNIVKAVKGWRDTHGTLFPYVHTDACQASLYLPLNVLKLGVDMMTLDGLKMYGPRSVGMLYVKNGVRINPVMFGGGQEKGLRSGTENVPGIVGFAKALEIAEKMKESEVTRLTSIRDGWISRLLNEFPEAHINGSQSERLPNNINICFPKADAEFLVVSLDVSGIAVSYSSSCRMLSENSSSYVVSALAENAGENGREDECSTSSLRLTLGRDTQEKDIERVVASLKKVIK